MDEMDALFTHVDCIACEDRPAPENNPCAVCGATMKDRAMDDLEERLRFTAKALDRVGLRGDGKLAIEAADRLRTYRKALERIQSARSAMDGGSIQECRNIARQALKG